MLKYSPLRCPKGHYGKVRQRQIIMFYQPTNKLYLAETIPARTCMKANVCECYINQPAACVTFPRL